MWTELDARGLLRKGISHKCSSCASSLCTMDSISQSWHLPCAFICVETCACATAVYLCCFSKSAKQQNACCLQVEQLIISELEKLKKDGFSSSAVEAALNSIEFDLRENNTGRFPRGLSLMLRSMSSWIYDKDPFQPLQWTDSLEHFKVSTISHAQITHWFCI